MSGFKKKCVLLNIPRSLIIFCIKIEVPVGKPVYSVVGGRVVVVVVDAVDVKVVVSVVVVVSGLVVVVVVDVVITWAPAVLSNLDRDQHGMFWLCVC